MDTRQLPQEQIVLVCCESDCKSNGGKKVCSRFKDELREQGCTGQIRIQRTRCMGCCGKGPNVMAYPSGVLYRGVKPKDVRTILDEMLGRSDAVPA